MSSLILLLGGLEQTPWATAGSWGSWCLWASYSLRDAEQWRWKSRHSFLPPFYMLVSSGCCGTPPDTLLRIPLIPLGGNVRCWQFLADFFPENFWTKGSHYSWGQPTSNNHSKQAYTEPSSIFSLGQCFRAIPTPEHPVGPAKLNPPSTQFCSLYFLQVLILKFLHENFYLRVCFSENLNRNTISTETWS